MTAKVTTGTQEDTMFVLKVSTADCEGRCPHNDHSRPCSAKITRGRLRNGWQRRVAAGKLDAVLLAVGR